MHYETMVYNLASALTALDKGGSTIDPGTVLKWVGLIVLAIIAVALIGFFLAFGKLWLQAISSGCPVPIR